MELAFSLGSMSAGSSVSSGHKSAAVSTSMVGSTLGRSLRIGSKISKKGQVCHSVPEQALSFTAL